MPDRTEALTLFEPVGDISDVQLPPRLADALAEVRAAIARCDEAGITKDTMPAALMTELMPRLVEAYGPKDVASILDQLAREITASGGPPLAIQ